MDKNKTNRPFLNLNESTISMMLGAVIVLLAGIIAYNYFRAHREVVTVTSPVKTAQEEGATTPTAPETQGNANGQIAQAQSAVALPATHTVIAGENLWVIAEQYYRSGYNYVDIVKVNNLANPNSIEVGQKLTIPKTEVRQPLTVSGAITPTITISRITGSNYTVQKGDNLWEISVRAYNDGYKWIQIAQANHLTNPNVIHSGNVLILPR